MPYHYTLFGSTAIPQSGQHPISFDVARGAWTPLSSGGDFDGYGSGAAPIDGATIALRCDLVQATTTAAWIAAFDAWKVLHRRAPVAALWRVDDAGVTQWRTARLMKPPADRTPDEPHMINMELVFHLKDPAWYGATQVDHTLSDIPGNADDFMMMLVESADYPVVFSVTNSGNIDQPDVTFTITAGDNSITGITITNVTTGHILIWAGTLATTKALVIDCGAQSIKNDGADAYSSLTPPTNKKEWFSLNPGANAVTIDITTAGTGETVRVQFYPAYA